MSAPERPLRVGVVGFGAMGRRHLRAMLAIEGLEAIGVADTSSVPHEPLSGVPVVRSLESLLDLGMDACVVASPSPDHVVSAVALAEAGVHALVEKPLAMDVVECQRISEAFAQAGRVGRVAHVERFNGALVSLRDRLARGELGALEEIVTRREGGPPRRVDGGDVVLDLGTHDLDLVSWLTGVALARVSVTAEALGAASPQEALRLTLVTESGLVTRHTVSWCSEVRVRTLVVRGDRGHLEADLLRGELRSGGRSELLPVAAHDPLTAQLQAFRDVVLGHLDAADPLAGASLEDGARAVALARSALASAVRLRPGAI